MLSVINPSQIQPGGHSTFPRPANPVSHNLSSSYNNISSTSSSNNSRIGHTISCNVSAFAVNSNFQARSSSNSVGDNIRNHNMIFASSNSNLENFSCVSTVSFRNLSISACMFLYFSSFAVFFAVTSST